MHRTLRRSRILAAALGVVAASLLGSAPIAAAADPPPSNPPRPATPQVVPARPGTSVIARPATPQVVPARPGTSVIATPATPQVVPARPGPAVVATPATPQVVPARPGPAIVATPATPQVVPARPGTPPVTPDNQIRQQATGGLTTASNLFFHPWLLGIDLRTQQCENPSPLRAPSSYNTSDPGTLNLAPVHSDCHVLAIVNTQQGHKEGHADLDGDGVPDLYLPADSSGGHFLTLSAEDGALAPLGDRLPFRQNCIDALRKGTQSISLPSPSWNLSDDVRDSSPPVHQGDFVCVRTSNDKVTLVRIARVRQAINDNGDGQEVRILEVPLF
jgi:hypothetical protein